MSGAPSAAATLSSVQARAGRAGSVPWLAAIMLLAVAVRAVHLGRASLWNDELFSVFYPRTGLRFMWTTGLSLEPDPPLYYSFAVIWQHVFGVGAAAIRSLSVLFSVLAIPLAYLLGTEVLDRRRAMLGALLLALSPMQLDFAQDARAYSLSLIPAGLMLLGLARFLRRGGGTSGLACYAVGGALGIYTHTSLIFLILACNIAALGWLAAAGSGRDFRRWVLANAAVAAAGLPEALAILHIMRAQGYAPGAAALTRFQFADVFSELIAGPAARLRFPGLELALLGFAAMAAGLWWRPPGRRTLLVLVGVPGCYVALALALTLGFHKPLFIARVFCWASIPASLLLAHAVLQPRYALLLRAAVAVVFAAGLGAQFSRAADPIEPWREVLPALAPAMAKADLVVMMPFTSAGAFALYAPQVGHLRVLRVDGPQTVETGFMHDFMGVPTLRVSEVARAIRAGQDVWTVGQYQAGELDRLLAETPPPTQRIERDCPNGKLCILALHWSAVPSR